MKRIYILYSILFFVCNNKLFAQNTPPFPLIDSYEAKAEKILLNISLDELGTNYFIDKAAPYINPLYFNGIINDSNHVDKFCWWRAYTTFFLAQKDSNILKNENVVLGLIDDVAEHSEGSTPLLFLFNEYDKFKKIALENHLVYFENGVLHDDENREESPFELNKCFVGAISENLFLNFHNRFILDEKLFFSNMFDQISSIGIDFDDGVGMRNINIGEAINVDYESNGVKHIIYKIVLKNDEEFYSHSYIKIQKTLDELTSNFDTVIISDIPYLGVYGSAQVNVVYACGNTQMRKPLIIIEGIDPIQLPLLGIKNQDYHDAYAYLMGSPQLTNTIKIEGYDLVFVDFKDGGDYIQRNAYIVEKIINWVNYQKVKSKSKSPNIVIGYSMGGLVARYAIRDMEIKNLQHDVEKYISFDSPHLGANTPIGFQYLLDHAHFFMTILSSNQYTEQAKTQTRLAFEMQHTPASRQMLIYQTQGIVLNQYPDIHTGFYAELNNMGMPINCRNISIVNGSGVGANLNQFNAGNKLLGFNSNNSFFSTIWYEKIGLAVLQYIYGTGMTVDLDVWSIPNQNQSWRKVYDGYYRIEAFWIAYFLESSIDFAVPTSFLPIDNAPGSYFEQEIVDVSGQVPGNFEPNLPKYFTFVPSVSAINLKYPEANNYNYNISTQNIILNNKTDFESFDATQVSANTAYIDPSNRSHVTVTSENDDFLMNELRYSYLPRLTNNIINNSTFNFTTLTYNILGIYNSTNFLVDQIDIQANGVIYINGNVPAAYNNSGLAHPSSNSIKDVYTHPCKSQNIIVNNLAKLELGNNSINSIGNLYLTSGTTLIIKNGGLLKVNNNSKLIIEKNSKLILEVGSVIDLNGLNAIVENYGTIELTNGTVLNKIGTGFIKFNGTNSESLKLGVNSKFIYNGTGLNDKIIQVVGGTVNVTTESGSEFNVSNANINFIAGILNIKSNLVLNSVKVNGGGDGLLVSGNNYLSINSCEFSGSNYGIKVDYTNPNGSAIEILNSTFTSHSYGIHIYGRAFNISGCSFTYLTNSITAQHYSDNSTIESCYITGFTETGITLLGSNFTVNMNNIFITPDENYSNYGLDIRECKATLTCSNIQAEKIPIFLGLNTTLDMSQQNGGDYGNNYIAINQYSNLDVTNQAVIKIESATNLFMDYGYNAIKKPSTINHYIHGGTLNFQNDIYARYNYWYPSYSSGNTMPSKLINFATSGTNVFFSPIVPSGVNQPSCNNNSIMSRISDPCTDPNGCPEDQNLLNNCSECNSVKFKGKSINLVLRKIIKEIKSDTLNLNTINHIMSLDSLINVSFIGNKPKVDLIKDRVLHLLLNQYSLINNNISYASVKPSILIKLTSTLNSRLARAINKDDTSRILQIHLIKAHLFLSENLHNQAINQFDNALNYVELNSEAYQTIQMQKCLVNIENLYENGLINDSVKMEMIISCENMQIISSRSSQIQNSTTQLPTLVTRYIKINPNPANDWLNVEFVNFYKNEAEITVYDLIGRIVLEKKLSLQGDGNIESTQLDISNLIQGTYIVKIKSNDFVKMHKQIVD